MYNWEDKKTNTFLYISFVAAVAVVSIILIGQGNGRTTNKNNTFRGV